MNDFKLELLDDMLKNHNLYEEVRHQSLAIKCCMELEPEEYCCLHICANEETRNKSIEKLISQKEKIGCNEIYRKGLNKVVLYCRLNDRKETHIFKTYKGIKIGLDGYRFNDFVIHKNMRFPYER